MTIPTPTELEGLLERVSSEVEGLYACIALEAIGRGNSKYAQGRRQLATVLLPIITRARATLTLNQGE